ncbi:putative bromodomain associated protein [Golovinomyces cichoracearum]|uniref:Transcription initiation factor TFIID subunit 8 n=1 Tax=Golovinomyces cichoracearum TaxID=62708 RepID=A0A420IIC4_9PEZI|nr:putative bromodomain associated protein [Golovinomyces cichoracearum]
MSCEISPLSLPQSRKRTSSESDYCGADEPLSKRIRLEPQSPKSVFSLNKPPKSENFPIMFDDGPYKLLLRSVSIALQHVGFNSATPEAMEAFCQEVETCQYILTVSMLGSRRSQPIPYDFQYALSEFDIPLLSIEPHLRPPVPTSKLLIQLELLPAEELPALTNAALFGDELSGEVDKNNKSYIPKKFPSFPSKHTYKWTEKDSGRDLDPRKIREEASKAAREGEESLRRLTKVGKAANEKNTKKIASRDPRSKERHEIWENVMDNLLSGGSSNNSSMASANNEVESTSMIVNAERPHFRKGTSARRNSPLSTDPFDSIRVS